MHHAQAIECRELILCLASYKYQRFFTVSPKMQATLMAHLNASRQMKTTSGSSLSLMATLKAARNGVQQTYAYTHTHHVHKQRKIKQGASINKGK